MSDRGAHYCADGHQAIWHNNSEHEQCPLCRAKDAYMNKAFDLAAQHVKAQHAVWDASQVPPSILLRALERNIEALKDHEWPDE